MEKYGDKYEGWNDARCDQIGDGLSARKQQIEVI